MLSEITEEIIGKTAFEQKKKNLRLNLTLGLSASRPLNNWAQGIMRRLLL